MSLLDDVLAWLLETPVTQQPPRKYYALPASKGTSSVLGPFAEPFRFDSSGPINVQLSSREHSLRSAGIPHHALNAASSFCLSQASPSAQPSLFSRWLAQALESAPESVASTSRENDIFKMLADNIEPSTSLSHLLLLRTGSCPSHRSQKYHNNVHRVMFGTASDTIQDGLISCNGHPRTPLVS